MSLGDAKTKKIMIVVLIILMVTVSIFAYLIRQKMNQNISTNPAPSDEAKVPIIDPEDIRKSLELKSDQPDADTNSQSISQENVYKALQQKTADETVQPPANSGSNASSPSSTNQAPLVSQEDITKALEQKQ